MVGCYSIPLRRRWADRAARQGKLTAVDESQALRALSAILARPEFTRPTVSLAQAFWTAVWDLVGQFLSWLFAPVRDVIAGHVNWLQLAGIAVALAVLIAAGWFAVRVLGFSVVRGGPETVSGPAARRERSNRLWREAQDMAAAGRLAEAIRALYLSALYALEEHDVLRVEEALTNREHAVRLARTSPDAGDAFGAVVQHYDPLRYGSSSVTPDAFEQLQAVVERLRVTSV